MNVGMLACYDQAKEVVAKLTKDPMTDGQPSLATKMGSSCIAVSDMELTCTMLSMVALVNMHLTCLFFLYFIGLYCCTLFVTV